MIRKAFFEDSVFSSMSEVHQREMRRALKKVDEFEESTGQSLENGFTREQYVDLFNSMRIRRTHNISHYKSLLLKYLQYLIADGTLDVEQCEILDSISADDLLVVDYYKNINMLYEAVSETIKAAVAGDSRDPDVFLPAAVSIFLTWYGLTLEEITNYRKEDVLDDGIVIKGEKITPPFHVLQFFTAMRDSEGYYQQAKGRIFHRYLYSEYLLRSRYKDHLKVSDVQNLLARINKVMGGEYALEFSMIRQSGIFFRAYLLECNSTSFDLDDPTFASKVFCEDFTGSSRKCRVAHLSRIKDYKLYKQLF